MTYIHSLLLLLHIYTDGISYIIKSSHGVMSVNLLLSLFSYLSYSIHPIPSI